MGKTNFPKWITANLGYGASGMISAVHNPSEVNGKNVPSFLRERKLFLGVSGAFTANNAITYPSWLNILKILAPVAQCNLTSDKISFRPLYYSFLSKKYKYKKTNKHYRYISSRTKASKAAYRVSPRCA